MPCPVIIPNIAPARGITAENPNADIAISFGGKNVRNGGSITPASGENVVTFTVSNGDAVRVYTVTITKS